MQIHSSGANLHLREWDDFVVLLGIILQACHQGMEIASNHHFSTHMLPVATAHTCGQAIYNYYMAISTSLPLTAGSEFPREIFEKSHFFFNAKKEFAWWFVQLQCRRPLEQKILSEDQQRLLSLIASESLDPENTPLAFVQTNPSPSEYFIIIRGFHRR